MYQGQFTDNAFDKAFMSERVGGLQTPVSCIAFPDAPYFIVRTPNSLFPDRVLSRDAFLNAVYDDPAVYSIKISPYPPFTKLSGSTYQNECFKFYDAGLQSDAVALVIDDLAIYANEQSNDSRSIQFNSGEGAYGFLSVAGSGLKDVFKASGIWVLVTNDNEYPYKPVEYLNFQTKPSTLVNKSVDYEPKLLFYPYTKYILKSQYSSGDELHPELIASTNPIGANMELKCVSTSYCGDLTYSIYPLFQNYTGLYTNVSQWYKTINKGVITSPSYTYPVGEDALKTFSQTQSSSYNTQALGKVIGGGLAVAGGVAMIATGYGSPAGAVAIASGVASIGTAIGGAVAKYSDLENTPDTINTLGGNIVHDYAVGNSLHPYLCIYEITPSEKEMIYDFFYEYGYVVNRCCKMNTEIVPDDYNDDYWVDTRLITRTHFNYIKISENISGKLHSDIPPIVKDKLNTILNNGIRLYTLFDVEFSALDPITNLYELYEGSVYENIELI